MMLARSRVAKVQCDFCCMISAAMFREFVVPGLTEQCDRLDHVMYHLDGTQALHQLDALLPRADWLMLACPLTTETRRLITARRLALLPKGAHIINIARQSMINIADKAQSDMII